MAWMFDIPACNLHLFSEDEKQMLNLPHGMNVWHSSMPPSLIQRRITNASLNLWKYLNVLRSSEYNNLYVLRTCFFQLICVCTWMFDILACELHLLGEDAGIQLQSLERICTFWYQVNTIIFIFFLNDCRSICVYTWIFDNLVQQTNHLCVCAKWFSASCTRSKTLICEIVFHLSIDW